eukprot:6478726-Amphidinium_carterae.1
MHKQLIVKREVRWAVLCCTRTSSSTGKVAQECTDAMCHSSIWAFSHQPKVEGEVVAHQETQQAPYMHLPQETAQ